MYVENFYLSFFMFLSVNNFIWESMGGAISKLGFWKVDEWTDYQSNDKYRNGKNQGGKGWYLEIQWIFLSKYVSDEWSVNFQNLFLFF